MYFRPRTCEEAIEALTQSGGRILAGGTDFFPALGADPVRRPIIDITDIAELTRIDITPDEVRIGAGVTWATVANASLPPAFDCLRLAAREVGAIQIQNTATIGGNLCNASPAADGMPPLRALDAEVELASPRGRRRLPVGDFVQGNRRTDLKPDEILTAVAMPRAGETGASSFLKLGARRYLVISIAMVAAVIEVEAERVARARIAIGACSPVAQRLPDAETALKGLAADARLSAHVRAEHLSGLSPITDVRAEAAYRRDAALTLVRRAVDRCVGAASSC